MMTMKATALAHPNIAFIKYWGMQDEDLKLPANDSISMNIGCLSTRTTVEYDPALKADEIQLNGSYLSGAGLARVKSFMCHLRQMTGHSLFARINSENNFPTGAGLASSASAFAALALAGTAALGLTLSEQELSSLARWGSGSACRSIPGGFVEWRTDSSTHQSYAASFASEQHWKLMDCIAIVSSEHKQIGSEAGMRLAATSPLQGARIQDTERRFSQCRQAILKHDFMTLSQVTELDCSMMHAVMMTSNPPLFYWQPQSLGIIMAVKQWQAKGLPVTYTLDAGPNVHVICPQEIAGDILPRLKMIPGVLEVLKGLPGGPARLIPEDSRLESEKV